MDRVAAMTAFVKVAELESFAGAARALNLTPPVVTRTISGLEDHLGTRLFIRTTRQVRLTESGQRYLEDCRRILADLEEAEANAAGFHAAPRGLVTVTASVQFGRLFVMPVLLDYLDEFPEVSAQAMFVDRIVNLIDEGMDIAVRIGHLPDSTLSAIRVGTTRRVICGSPAYFERHGIPQTPEDLAQHRIIAAAGSAGNLEWRLGRNSERRIAVTARMVTSSNESAIEAAEKGWGLTRLMAYHIAPQLLDGRLQTVFSGDEEPLPIHIVHAHGRRVPAKVRHLVDRLRTALSANRIIN